MLLAEIATAVALFAGTNIDDAVVLSVLSAASRAGGRPRRWEIWAGQYAGFAVLIGVSLAVGRGLALVPGHLLWVLGLVPLGLGVVNLIAAVRSHYQGRQPRAPSAGGAFGVAVLTIANGGDNLAAYTPFFAATGTAQAMVTLAVFAGCIALWCGGGALLTSHPRVIRVFARYGHWILPMAYILIGLYILHKLNAPIWP